MLWGLTRVSGLAGSLLLNLETAFTIVLAVGLFGEHLSRREAAAAALVVAGGALIGARGEWSGSAAGAAAIALACLCWALDNNFSARLALKDPVRVLRVKALCARVRSAMHLRWKGRTRDIGIGISRPIGCSCRQKWPCSRDTVQTV